MPEFIQLRRIEFVKKLVRECRLQSLNDLSRSVQLKFYIWDKLTLTPILNILFATSILLMIFIPVFVINTGFPFTQIFEILGFEELASILEEYSLTSIVGSLIDNGISALRAYLTKINVPSVITSIICDGILTGVGAVLSFLPLIFIILLTLSILEDCGIMTRIALVYHNFLSKFAYR